MFLFTFLEAAQKEFNKVWFYYDENSAIILLLIDLPYPKCKQKCFMEKV